MEFFIGVITNQYRQKQINYYQASDSHLIIPSVQFLKIHFEGRQTVNISETAIYMSSIIDYQSLSTVKKLAISYRKLCYDL